MPADACGSPPIHRRGRRRRFSFPSQTIGGRFTVSPTPVTQSAPEQTDTGAAAVAPAPRPRPERFGSALFFIALDVVAESWPDGVRQEIAQLKIPDAKVALPPVEICESLKRGRIQISMADAAFLIQPTPLYATALAHDDVMLELPLRTLTPLFLISSGPIR